MDSNLAYEYSYRWVERIDGIEVYMSPRPVQRHNRVSFRIARLFADYLEGKPCTAIADGAALYLKDDGDYYVPDMMVVCDPEKDQEDGVHGAPDLVVEVLSPGTAKNDRGRKLNDYGRYGVREYWIVDAEHRTIEQYLPEDGQLKLSEMYTEYSEFDLGLMSDAERAAVVTEFRCTLFDDFVIRVSDVFQDIQ